MNWPEPPDILACPLCGSEADYDFPTKNQVRIKCCGKPFGCTCQITGKFLRQSREWLLNKMIERWNTRKGVQSANKLE